MSSLQQRSSFGQRGLDARFAICEKLFNQEFKSIFGTHWVCIGTLDQLAKSPITRKDLYGRSIIFTVDDQRCIRCFYNICRHRGAELISESNSTCRTKNREDGDCDDEQKTLEIVCPYHAWRYGPDGQLKTAANMNGVEGFEKHNFGLREINCRVWQGLVWICFEEKPPDFDAFFGLLDEKVTDWKMSSLATHRTIKYDVQANWKLIFQNYNECYHCPTVHPALNRLTPFKKASNDFLEGPILGGPMSLSKESQSMTIDGLFADRPLSTLSEEQRRSVAYYTVFPTLFISLHPDYVLLHHIQPVKTNLTEVTCEFLFADKTNSENKNRRNSAVTFWDQTNLQDWAVCERVQLGMMNPGYTPGPYSNLESVVAAFDRNYLKSLSDLEDDSEH